MPDLKQEVRGFRGELALLREQSYGKLPATPQAVELLFVSEDMDGGRPQKTKDTIRGRNMQGRPNAGNLDVSGNLTLPANVQQIGVFLRALSGGAPVTTSAVSAQTLAAGAVENLGAGLVGINCPGHGLCRYAQCTISGTTNYDGVHTLEPETTADQLVIRALYVEETLAGTETVTLGAVRKLSAGAVRDAGAGLVGIGCPGHGYLPGDSVTITNTDNYNGTFVLVDETSTDELVFASAYAEETLDGSETVAHALFLHRFIPGNTSESFTIQRKHDVADGDDDEEYWAYGGCKINQLSISSGGDNQLQISVALVGAGYSLNAATLGTGTPAKFSDFDFENFDAVLLLAGEQLGDISSADITLGRNLETDKYFLGDKGRRGRLPEGFFTANGNLTALYTDNGLVKRAINRRESELRQRFVTGPYRLDFILPEVLLEEQGAHPKISGPQGIQQQFKWNAFWDRAASGCVIELVNGVASY